MQIINLIVLLSCRETKQCENVKQTFYDSPNQRLILDSSSFYQNIIPKTFQQLFWSIFCASGNRTFYWVQKIVGVSPFNVPQWFNSPHAANVVMFYFTSKWYLANLRSRLWVIEKTRISLWALKPGLTSQRHSALISSDSEYFQVCFSAVHYLKISEQRWFSSEQRWKRKFSELKISAEKALIFSETALNSADFWIIQNDNCWFIFHYFQNLSKYLNFEAHNSGFQPSLRKEVSNQNLLLHFRTIFRHINKLKLLEASWNFSFKMLLII